MAVRVSISSKDLRPATHDIESIALVHSSSSMLHSAQKIIIIRPRQPEAVHTQSTQKYSSVTVVTTWYMYVALPVHVPQYLYLFATTNIDMFTPNCMHITNDKIEM